MFLKLARVLPKVLLTEPDVIVDCYINMDLVSWMQDYKGEVHIMMEDGRDIVVKDTLDSIIASYISPVSK